MVIVWNNSHSILDNVFTFWEATPYTSKHNQDLAILLLDFEKACDLVDWAFLRGFDGQTWISSTVDQRSCCFI
jgi:hypothetical protein